MSNLTFYGSEKCRLPDEKSHTLTKYGRPMKIEVTPSGNEGWKNSYYYMSFEREFGGGLQITCKFGDGVVSPVKK